MGGRFTSCFSVLLKIRVRSNKMGHLGKCQFNFFFCPQLSHHLFEELASDVYDEVDRRECDAGTHSANILLTNGITYLLNGVKGWCKVIHIGCLCSH